MTTTIMEQKRLELQSLLETTLGSGNVYFQPPESLKMKYPAIVYNRSDLVKRFADNGAYIKKYAYDLTVIDKDPDSEIVDKVASLPLTSFQRHFTADNLNHDIFQIYY